jgi:hypothetical protein
MTDINLTTLSVCIQSVHAERWRILGLLESEAGRNDPDLQQLECDYGMAMAHLKVLYQERTVGVVNHSNFESLLSGQDGALP